ncbi:MAG: family 78 glycoside hydrolase catalytic domain [Chthoniobacteraceae bacterium]
MKLAPINLRVIPFQHPLGIDDLFPVLHWEMPPDSMDLPPEWQIQVADSRDALERGEANCWDSGWVCAPQANETVYRGRAGGSRERFWWRARFRTERGEEGEWSERHWWEYGLLHRDDWSAEWISSGASGGPRQGVAAPFLRKEFSLPAAPVRARLYITALGLYECEINGRAIAEDLFTPGWTDYRKRVQVQTYDVTRWLQAGDNAIGAILGDGWYCGHVFNKGREHFGTRPALCAQLEVELEDGSSHRIATDGTWQFATGPILENDLIMGESYDARLELNGWSSAGYVSDDWLKVKVEPAPGIALSASAGPRVRRKEVFPLKRPLRTDAGANLRWIFDVGQNIAGRVRIAVRGPKGAVFQIRHAEMLDEKGELYVASLRSARCTDLYVCKGREVERWEPRFTFHGFRFVEVSASTPETSIESLEAFALYSDMEETGAFSCSHALLNQLFKNIGWGMKGNFLEVPTDCPQRDERLGWTGDAQVFVSTAAFLGDVRGFFHKWMLDVADAQRSTGSIPSVAPFVACYEDGGPAWSDAAVICPWEIYRAYGDERILERNYRVMQRFVDFLRTTSCKDDIRSHPDINQWHGHGDWLGLDGGVDREGNTPKDLIATAFLAYDLELLTRIASILGNDADAAAYWDWRENVVRAFRRRFLTRDNVLVGNTQTARVLALHFNLLPEEARPVVARELVKDIQWRSDHLTTGFVGTPYLCQALEDSGHLDVAYRLLEQESFPSWLFPVKNGATTIWERWDGWTPEKGFQSAHMNSFNHYAYGAVGAWMVRTVAGLELDPGQPGGRRLIFRPRPGGTITRASARRKLVCGETSIAWELEPDALHVEVAVPVYSTATLIPPSGYVVEQREFGPGNHRMVLQKQLENKPAVAVSNA